MRYSMEENGFDIFVEQYRLGVFTGEYAVSGYCSYPIYKFDLDKLNSYTRV